MPLACTSAIERSLISARADRSNSLMSAACFGGCFGSIPIAVRLRTSRRTPSSLVCNSAKVGLPTSKPGCRRFPGFHNGCCSRGARLIAGWVFCQRPLAISRAFTRSPPRAFIAGLVQLPMMAAAQRHREFITDFEANGSGLCKPQVMRIGGLPAADEAGL